MTEDSLIELPGENDGSVAEVLKAIGELRSELEEGRTSEWENPTLERYLSAMESWIEGMGPRLGQKPSWKLVEVILRTAATYE